MASRIQKKNKTKNSPRKIAGAVLSLPALKYGDSRTFFIESASYGFGAPQGVVHTGLAVNKHGQVISLNPCLFTHLMTLPPKRQQNLLHNIITYSNKLSHADDSAYYTIKA